MQIKESIKRLILIVIVLALLIFASMAWFIENREVKGNNLSLLSEGTSDVSGELWQNINATWTKIPSLKIENMVAGQKLEYKVILKNITAVNKAVTLQLTEVLEDALNAPTKMIPMLSLSDVPALADGGTPSVGGKLDTLLINNNLTIYTGAIVNAGSTKDILFSITLDSAAKNIYQEKKVNVKAVDVVYN
ncbi:MAG: hypothetical protein RR436_05560 [Clostridia bacterium]